MKMKHLPVTALAAVAALMLAPSCQDTLSSIGGDLVDNEVTINVDSLETAIDAVSVYDPQFDGRSTTKLLGRINVPEYGSLSCSFVSQMLSATSLSIPDSIPVEDVDSMKLILSVPRGSLTGDSLAPQQLRVYLLDKQLPSDITSTFDPEGYYSPSGLLGQQSYTLSNIARGDSAMKSMSYVRVPVTLPLSLAHEIVNKYRNDDPIFQWPATFNQWFPGIYVEQNFGNGCIANISKAEIFTYWNRINRTYDMQADSTYAYVDHIVRDSLCIMSSQPEVLSSNVINYKVSDKIKALAESGKSVMTTPGGYTIDIKFPLERLIEAYLSNDNAMSMVSALRLAIPAEEIENDYGIGVAPYLLMVKKSEREAFFNENKVPDSKTSFYAPYDSTTGYYNFSTLRPYFLAILESLIDGETIDDEDLDFCLVPVDVTTESVTSYSSTTVYVTRVSPYIVKPTMTLLHTDKAIVTFIYSSQVIE